MKNIIQRDIEDAFFEAMQSGYAESVAKERIAELPGSKSIFHQTRNGLFQVRDTWIVSPGSDVSSGFTIISNDGVPVWMMHYGGWYSRLAIPFLKQCLHKAYVERRVFYGGRGPEFVREGLLTYVNTIGVNDFRRFNGSERIFNADGAQLGYHWYQGGTFR